MFWWRNWMKWSADVKAGILQILIGVKSIMATQAELVQKLTTVGTQLDKVATESAVSVKAVTDLQAQVAALIAAGSVVTPELQAAVDAVVAKVQAVDDLIPDAPTP